MDDDTNVRFSDRPEAERGKMSERLRAHIVARLADELIGDFGYDYNSDAGHFRNYD